MNAEVTLDLQDVQYAMEDLQKRLPKMALKEKIDVAARLRAVAKAVKAMDDAVKDEIKTKLNHKTGVLPGELFRASLGLVPTTRLNQKKLEVEQPRIYTKYCETTDVERITFEVR